MSASPPRLAIVSTHPIQYYAPVFRALAASNLLDVQVFYTYSQAALDGVFDSGFGTDIKWDIPLLDGYGYQFVRNVAGRPGLDHFGGVETPSLVREITAWRADAVLVYTWNSRSHLTVLRQLKGRIPVLFRGDSTLLDHRPWWRVLLRRIFLTWVYAHVDVAIAVGTRNHEYFAWCGLPSNRIALAPHSVDTRRFALIRHITTTGQHGGARNSASRSRLSPYSSPVSYNPRKTRIYSWMLSPRWTHRLIWCSSEMASWKPNSRRRRQPMSACISCPSKPERYAGDISTGRLIRTSFPGSG